ncbi:MAG: TadE family protein [Pirellulaceae bacterium]
MPSFKQSRRRKLNNASRRGVAVVELAVCLPVIVFLLLATIEACVMLQIQQNAAITAYEGARIGIMPGADASVVQLQCGMLLDDRGIENYTILTSPSDLSSMEVGDQLTVTVEIDCSANSVIGGTFIDGKTISESVVMKAE